MAAREDQETIVTMGRIDDHMTIWTNNVVHARALERESRAVRTSPPINTFIDKSAADQLADHLEAGFGVEYRVKAEDARILNVFARKRKPMTEAQKKAAGERLRAGKEG